MFGFKKKENNEPSLWSKITPASKAVTGGGLALTSAAALKYFAFDQSTIQAGVNASEPQRRIAEIADAAMDAVDDAIHAASDAAAN